MEMDQVDLTYFTGQEENGVIYAKISKSHDFHEAHGSYFDYSEYIGKTLSNILDPDFQRSTIEDLATAFWYFHYGDQITIVSFSKIDETLRKQFQGFKNGRSNCYDVNMIYVEKILRLNDRATMDFILEHISPEDVLSGGKIAVFHLRNHGCNEGADYLQERMDKLLHPEADTEKNTGQEEPAQKKSIRQFLKDIITHQKQA